MKTNTSYKLKVESGEYYIEISKKDQKNECNSNGELVNENENIKKK